MVGKISMYSDPKGLIKISNMVITGLFMLDSKPMLTLVIACLCLQCEHTAYPVWRGALHVCLIFTYENTRYTMWFILLDLFQNEFFLYQKKTFLKPCIRTHSNTFREYCTSYIFHSHGHKGDDMLIKIKNTKLAIF